MQVNREAEILVEVRSLTILGGVMNEKLEVTENEIALLQEILKPVAEYDGWEWHVSVPQRCCYRFAEALGVDPTTISIHFTSSSSFVNLNNKNPHFSHYSGIWRNRFTVTKSASAWKPEERALYHITLILSDAQYEKFWASEDDLYD